MARGRRSTFPGSARGAGSRRCAFTASTSGFGQGGYCAGVENQGDSGGKNIALGLTNHHVPRSSCSPRHGPVAGSVGGNYLTAIRRRRGVIVSIAHPGAGRIAKVLACGAGHRLPSVAAAAKQRSFDKVRCVETRIPRSAEIVRPVSHRNWASPQAVDPRGAGCAGGVHHHHPPRPSSR